MLTVNYLNNPQTNATQIHVQYGNASVMLETDPTELKVLTDSDFDEQKTLLMFAVPEATGGSIPASVMDGPVDGQIAELVFTGRGDKERDRAQLCHAIAVLFNLHTYKVYKPTQGVMDSPLFPPQPTKLARQIPLEASYRVDYYSFSVLLDQDNVVVATVDDRGSVMAIGLSVLMQLGYPVESIAVPFKLVTQPYSPNYLTVCYNRDKFFNVFLTKYQTSHWGLPGVYRQFEFSGPVFCTPELSKTPPELQSLEIGHFGTHLFEYLHTGIFIQQRAR